MQKTVRATVSYPACSTGVDVWASHIAQFFGGQLMGGGSDGKGKPQLLFDFPADRAGEIGGFIAQIESNPGCEVCIGRSPELVSQPVRATVLYPACLYPRLDQWVMSVASGFGGQFVGSGIDAEHRDHAFDFPSPDRVNALIEAVESIGAGCEVWIASLEVAA